MTQGIVRAAAAGVAAALMLVACTARPPSMAPEPTPQAPATEIEQPSFTQSGLASWYGTERRGRVTASGEHFDPRGLTAAHLTLPIGTVVRVTSADTGKSIKVRINDRGPHARNRIIDLSAQAAAALDLRGEGVGAVTLAVYAADQ